MGGRFCPPSQRLQLNFPRGYVPAYHVFNSVQKQIIKALKTIFEEGFRLSYGLQIQEMFPCKSVFIKFQIFNSTSDL